MRVLGCFLLLTAACARADEASDRAAIEKVIDALNDARPNPELYATGVSVSERDLRLAQMWCGMDVTDRPMSEVTKPRIIARSIQFVTGDVALVDAASSQYGSLIGVRRFPIVVVMKREEGMWKIAAIRAMAICSMLGITGAARL